MILINGDKMNPKDLPQLPKKAVFQLIGKYSRQEYDKKNRRYFQINAQSFILPTSYTTHLEERGETVEIRYAKTETPQYTSDGKNVKKYMPNHILFQKNGMLIVNTQDNDLYYFMLNCPKLDKGDGKGNPSFILVNPQKNATDEKLNFRIEHEAVSMLIGKDRKNMYDQRKLAEAFQLDNDVDQLSDEMVTTLLIKHAKKDPRKFLNLISSAEINIKVCIAMGKKNRIIEFETPTRKWKWAEAVNSAVKDIVVVPVSRDPEEYLIEWFLRTDNSGVLAEIEALTNRPKDSTIPLSTNVKINPEEPKPGANLSNPLNQITEELKQRARNADMPLQGTHNMTIEKFTEKLEGFEKKKAARQLA